VDVFGIVGRVKGYCDEKYRVQDQIQSLQLALDRSMAFHFPLTQNPHDLAQGLRKVKTLNGTVDENPVTKGSDTGFQELSCRYRDYFHSDRAAISSSLNPSMQPSSSVRKYAPRKSKRQY